MTQQGTDLIGRTLARTYQIERLLGGGGMGAVYAARHVRTGGQFAVKVLHRETAADADIYKRFQDEARTVSALRHPHIVAVTDFDRDEDGTPFIVMEMLEGEDLYQRLCRVGKLPVDMVLDIGRQIGGALHAAHEKGVVHRDIKPQNIFLVRHEIAEVVHEVAKVVDFGISKIRRTGAQMTRDMTILGTPQFMSPEAALGQNSQLDGRADQWSLAVILYLALSGRLPFDSDNLVSVLYMVVHEQAVPLKQLAPEVPDHMVAAIERAMSKRKEDRFPRMVDFVRAISGNTLSAGKLSMQSALFRVLPGSEVPGGSSDAIVVPYMMPLPGGPVEVPNAMPVMTGQPAPALVPPAGRPPTPRLAPSPPPAPAAMSAQPFEQLTRPMVQPAPQTDDALTLPVGFNPEKVSSPTAATALNSFEGHANANSNTTPTPTPIMANPTDGELDFDPPTQVGDEPVELPTEPYDLQAQPTRVAAMPLPSPPTLAATQPMTALKRSGMGMGMGGGLEGNFSPDTLTRAAGQTDVPNLRGGLVPRLQSGWNSLSNIQWAVLGRQFLRGVGLVPRSWTRLAVVAGSTTLLLALLFVVIGLRNTSHPVRPPDPVPVTKPDEPGPNVGPSPALTPDGGAGAHPGTGTPGTGPTPEDPDKTGKGNHVGDGKGGKKNGAKRTGEKKKGDKSSADSGKPRIKIDPGV